MSMAPFKLLIIQNFIVLVGHVNQPFINMTYCALFQSLTILVFKFEGGGVVPGSTVVENLNHNSRI